MNWQAYDYYLFAAAALLGTLFAALALLWVLERPRWIDSIGRYGGVVPPFINVLGVLFGLTLAFLANDTWNAQDRALAAIDSEADALRSIVILARQLPADETSHIQLLTRNYAEAAIAEWPLLAARQSSPQASAAADALLAGLSNPKIAHDGSAAISQAETSLALSIRNAREARVALSQTHVNPLKWLVMAFLGFLTMTSIAVVHIGNSRAMTAAVLIFALASGPTAVVVLIHGNPFQPPAAVMPVPLQTFLESQG